MKDFLIAIRVFLALTLLTGAIYPLIVTVVGQAAFPAQANGSLIQRDGAVVGSHLVGQTFDDPKYFWGRPSATSPSANNASASSGSNLGPTNPALKEAIQVRIKTLLTADPDNKLAIPTDLVTASASGLDPHISIASANYQVARVARLRGLSPTDVELLVKEATQLPMFGILGEPVVNVLELNLKLDAQPRKK